MGCERKNGQPKGIKQPAGKNFHNREEKIIAVSELYEYKFSLE